ncbi:MAG: amino acid permease, partial [Planctomycetota bacterium]|nr:amino acid permease [Planctomycetota bacterium]
MNLFDATMVVVGSMIGSGIFIVSADMCRLLGSPGWLLIAWILTGLLTVAGALVYGELAGMFPRAGGQYVFLREAYSPLCGFLYGWTLFLVIQTGTIAAVAVAFARFTGVLFPWFSETNYLVEPFHLTAKYAISLSTAQLTAIVLIAGLTISNIQGLRYGKLVQNVFTVAKTGALLGLIILGLTLGWNSENVHEHFSLFWTRSPTVAVEDGLTAVSTWGLIAALGVAQVGSLFSADSWHVISFAAEEVENPRRNLPLSMALGTIVVTGLYLLANFAYLAGLSQAEIQTAANDRVGTALMAKVFPVVGAQLMAGAIMVSTFGCNNGLILSGARAYYAMARDGLFFQKVGTLGRAKTPVWGLALQAAW